MRTCGRRIEPGEDEEARTPAGKKAVSAWVRAALVALLVAAAFLAGHCLPAFLHPGKQPRPSGRGSGAVMYQPDEGRDAPDIPAPPRAKREGMMSSRADRGDMMLRYASEASMAEVVEFYRTAMPARGWRERGRVPAQGAERPGVTISYSNNAGIFCIIAITEAADGGTGITILRRRRPEFRPGRDMSARKEDRK